MNAPNPLFQASPPSDGQSARADWAQAWLLRWVNAGPQTLRRGLTVGVLVALAVSGYFQYQNLLSSNKTSGQMEAQVLEDHASRLLDTVSVTTSYLAQQIASAPSDPRALGELLERPLMTLPYVRNLYLLDSKARVVASSIPGEVGQQANLSRLGALPSMDRDSLGAYVAGQSLVQPAKASAAAPIADADPGFVPITRAVSGPRGEVLYLVVLLNPQSLTVFQHNALSHSDTSAFWLKSSGELLASRPPGHMATLAPQAKPFKFPEWMGKQAAGAEVDVGIGGDTQLIAFQVAANRPLVVVVERPYTGILVQWMGRMLWSALLALALIGFIHAVFRAIQRSTAQRVAAHDRLRDAQDEALGRERRLYNLVRGVHSVLIRTDEHGAVQYVNDRWTQVTGVPMEQVVGRPLADLFDVEGQPGVDALVADINASERRACAVSLTNAAGERRYFDLTLAHVGAHGEHGGLVGTLIDTTEREQAKVALREQLDFSLKCLEVNPLPVSAMDEQGRITYVNAAWEEFTGLRRGEVVGKPSNQVLGATAEAFQATVHQELMASGGGSVCYEAQIPHHDGVMRDMVVTQAVLPLHAGPDGKPVLGSINTMMDVSEYRKSERTIQEAKEQLERTYQAKCAFTGHVSRQIKTPLQTILGFSELGKERAVPRDMPMTVLHGMFEDIQDAGRRIQGLIDELLDLASIDAEGTTLDKERADLRALVYPVLREVDNELSHKHIAVAKELGATPLMVRVDTHWLSKVLRHAVRQTAHYSAEGSTLLIHAAITANDTIALTVAERRPEVVGADNEVMVGARVTPSDTMREVVEHSLALSRKIIEVHDGQMEVDMSAEQGLSFRIELPRHRRFNGLSNF